MSPARLAWHLGSSSRRTVCGALGGCASLVVFALVLLGFPGTASAAAPTVAKLSASSGPSVGGATVIISGSGFTGLSGADAVSFGGTSAASYHVDSAGQITAVTPAHSVGEVDVVVTASGLPSADTAADDYTFLKRYDQTNAFVTWTGGWAGVADASAWKGSYSRSSASGAYASVTFNGTRLDWVAARGPTEGLVAVYLDGAPAGKVNLYNVTALFQQYVWSTGDLPAGSHRVSFIRDAASVPGAYATIDAVDILGNLTGYHRLEQSDGRIAYKGAWATVTAMASSLGTYKRSADASAAVIVDFTGTYVAWVATKGPVYGKARVSLDGADSVGVDLSSASWQYQVRVWRSGVLPSGKHELKIWYDASSASGSFIDVDAFETDGWLDQAYFMSRYEQYDPRVVLSGAWSTVVSSSASAGSFKTGGAGAGISVQFSGTRLDWIATLGPTMGKADVSVDGKPAVSVDLFNSATVYQKAVYSTGTLAAGKHVVEIDWDEGNAAGASISLDAFDVAGTLPWPSTVSSALALWVEQRLSDLSYRPGPVDGVIDTKTRGAVIAFQKWEGMTRNGDLTVAVLDRLSSASRPRPARTGTTNPWIEVNKTKQVLLYCKNGAVVWTLPVSTGSASVGIATPSGTFKVTRKTLETSPRYKPLYISTTLLAIHGYPSVPTYPASHGCVRTNIWDQDELWPLIAVGTAVYIY